MLVYLQHKLPTLCFRNPIKRAFSRLLGLWPIGKPVDVTGWTHMITEKGVSAEDKVDGLRLRRHRYSGGEATAIDQASIGCTRESWINELAGARVNTIGSDEYVSIGACAILKGRTHAALRCYRDVLEPLPMHNLDPLALGFI